MGNKLYRINLTYKLSANAGKDGGDTWIGTPHVHGLYRNIVCIPE